MRKIIIASLAAFSLCASLAAQETKPQVKIYGFIRNYATVSTRESVAGVEDFFYYVPKDENIVNGVDLNEHTSATFAALTSRLGVDVTGYQVNDLKFGAKIETDFYSGVSGVTGTATLRLRQAYVTVGKDDWLLKIGQAWHPIAADQPDVISLNAGAPLNAFSRTPLVNFDIDLSEHLYLSAAAIWQMQYTSAGPEGASANYIKYGCTPEIYLGLNYKSDNLTLRAGASMLSIKPRYTDGTAKVSDRITTFNPYLYGKYSSGKFSVSAKTIYAQGGEHMNLNGGYAIRSVKSDGISYNYSPTRNSSSWISFKYGKKVQGILFGGYVKNFGTKDKLTYGATADGYVPASNVYFSKNSFSNMNQMYRVVPAVVWNIGKFALGLEYELTGVQYGDYKRGTNGTNYIGDNGLAEDNLHWITNHRAVLMVKFTF